MAWKGIVGKSFTPDAFEQYVHTLHWTTWRPSFVVLHNTGSPSLAQRPAGLTQVHISNLEAYYRDQQKWSAGPHLFVDDHQIWVFTPLTVSGVHSPSWNSVAFGVEMLGDFSKEPFDSGRGLLVQQNAVAAVASLSAVLGLDSSSMKLHKEDTATDHDCPGSTQPKKLAIGHVDKLDFIKSVHNKIVDRHSGDHKPHA